MPRRDDVHKVLIIGSGPIVIGQACEFDYSGTQACKALRKLGYQVVLVNSNPATIMTDPIMADETYIEPLNIDRLTEIIRASRPDGLLPNLGGQTALNLSTALDRAGVLADNGVQMIGISQSVIERGEDREAFKRTMAELGVDMPRSKTVGNVEDAEAFAAEIGYPCVIRPAYTMGGTGGGFVNDVEELRTTVYRGLQASPIDQVLVEESILGWEELELEVVRDASDQIITVCFIENVDAVGVHTGDSFCTAPMLTIDPQLQAELQEISYRIVRAIGVVGGTNVQLAHNPRTGRVVVIEINPRTSRSSALASKATGFPIAMVSTLLAAGLTLDEIPYWRDGTLDRYTPDGDYVVAKFARWAFEKLPGAVDRLGTQMRAVGEVMSIGKDYREAFGKAIRGLENGRTGLGNAADFRSLGLDELLRRVETPTSDRQYLLYEALRAGATPEQLEERTHIKAWFHEQMKAMVDVETRVEAYRGRLSDLPADLLRAAKEYGFGDAYLAGVLGVDETELRARRLAEGITHRYEAVPVSGVEGAEYYFSTYAPERANPLPAPEPVDRDARKVMVLGGGPNRIGQGIEFDYCCVHAAYTLRDAGFETIMVNCNPETVSTDYDTSDRLYFEPLTVEDVLAIFEREQPDGVVCQFGGQTPLNIARALEAAGVPILGTSPETIDLAEDRDRFSAIMDRLGIPMPEAGMAVTVEEAVEVARGIGFPVICRPSYVLGGRGMEIIHDEESLTRYMAAAQGVTRERPILIDRFLDNAMECEADAICDGQDAFVPAVMEHIEYAGIHSGDSACLIPSVNIGPEHLATIEDYTRRIAIELGVVGLMNIQYAIHDGIVYVLEANPRASRTVPLVSKVCDVNMARLATRLMLGDKLADLGLTEREVPFQGVKEAVFPFSMFPEVDPLLGPEMRSTGEVLGLATDAGLAFFKAQEATQSPLPTAGTVLMTVAERDRLDNADTIVTAARSLVASGLTIRATEGTQRFLAEHGIESGIVSKLHQGHPNLDDEIRAGQVQLVVNTPAGRSAEYDDSYIRKGAIRTRTPYITTAAGALAAAEGIAAQLAGAERVRSLQEWHATIR
ncbi:carbamoyl-phosphate synthase large subunit [Raineyella antarctica]|uniref:Carbamoyl-phosphate synthase large subunit n=1 Tax=Raineyella antarctica TaxID=1577474 RepID=A0A1G6GDC1_9ACTN|nr:carbamoyl-phosphate synthase large subunit [Raineyella antarctica]SDB79998.1 carbamoyl-phosphate synthase large subunit [Raineyella antarctica]